MTLTNNHVNEYLGKYEYTLLSTYVKNIIPIEIECPNGHIYTCRWNDFQQGKRCATCAWEKLAKERKFSIEFIREKFEKRDWKLLSKEYINSRQKLKAECPNGHICEIAYDKFKQGRGCKECYHLSQTGEGSHFYKGKIEVKCAYCGKIKEIFPSRIDRNKNHFCNTECAGNWQSDNIIGDNHPNWKGGIACEPYCDAWADKEYKEDIKKRDGYKCLNPDCWGTTDTLCIMHIDNVKKNCHPSNLITGCTSCNARAQQDREWWTAWYQAIMYKRYGYTY